MNALADAAFELAFDGHLVFPLRPGMKTPATEHGVKDATADVERAKRWWAKHPDCNIGVACGHRYDVFDVDDARQLDPAILLAVVNLEGPMVQTPSGGAHFYGAPGACGNRAKFVPGCDWRGLGGYVVAPPSRDHRGIWEWANGCDLFVPIPTWPPVIIEALAPPPARKFPAEDSDRQGSPEKALEGLIRTVVTAPVGRRNDALNWAAYRARDHVGAGRIESREAAVGLISAGLQSGLPEKEVVATVRSGLGEV